MCVGIPMQVVSVRPGMALCAHDGAVHCIDIALVGECHPGEWLMTFLGAAREKMDETAARQSLAAVTALEALLRGEAVDLDAAFADLIGREPQLPEHLRIQNLA
ncbi:HypC/HybG/HupF family hydrogenase formation chaperone [Novosphingobium sp. FSY-8]|uniref:HypC/HybG/HupF family hydrogenase formation chaperone n=1 Tax=Novosphingobium ovatum TaxID=1908523 RepID=A0ABW9X9L6_9SPHN|nr:HypC/HybG/HupF family hydrogenase formation chaperone [Novosphingobium ovatum]NBC35228.1 HypC/HybG/HupF family hydrogenase formation chaperone [Novosphingobium ovatum]